MRLFAAVSLFAILFLVLATSHECAGNDGFEISALFDAVKTGDTDTVERLVRAGGTGAVRYQNGKEVVNGFLRLFSRSPKNSTFLHFAVFYKQFDTAEMLLEMGADVSTKNNDGNTALHYAVAIGLVDMVELLLDYGAKNLPNKEGETPLDIAASKNLLEIVVMLLKHRPEMPDNTAEDTLLNLAAKKESLKTVEFLLNNNAEMSPGTYGDTPIHHAARGGHFNMVLLLINHEIDVNARNEDGNTPLYEAAQNGHVLIVQALLQKGAEIDVSEQNSPLFVAAQSGYTEIVILLLERQRSFNERVRACQERCLDVAMANGHFGVVMALVGPRGKVSFDKKMELLGWNNLHCAVNSKNLTSVRAHLMGLFVDRFAVDNIEATPLHYAAYFNYRAIAEELLIADLDVNAQDKEGMTALHFASQEGHSHMVRILMSYVLRTRFPEWLYNNKPSLDQGQVIL